MSKNYKVLTFNVVQKKFWDKRLKKGKMIKYSDVQDYNESFPLDFTEVFVPNGNLLVVNKNTREELVLHDYLSTGKAPYKDEYADNLHLYYLRGYKGDCGDFDCAFYPYDLQICRRPLNACATSCINATLCLIPKK